MKRTFLAALLFLALGVAAYESFTLHDQTVQVAEDGVPPPPSFP